MIVLDIGKTSHIGIDFKMQHSYYCTGAPHVAALICKMY